MVKYKIIKFSILYLLHILMFETGRLSNFQHYKYLLDLHVLIICYCVDLYFTEIELPEI